MSTGKNSTNFTTEAAFAALFKPDETIGFSGPKTAPFRSWNTPRDGSVYFCINPLTGVDAPLQNEYVTEYRNLLVEFDDTKRPSQEATIKRLKIPYNTKTWSGGKSLQLIISLNEPCVDEAEYKRLFRMLVAVIPSIDKKVGTLSRLARIPNAVRENGELQKLLDVTGRTLTKSELIEWARRANLIAFTNWEWTEAQLVKKETERRNKPPVEVSDLKPLAFRLREVLEGRTSGRTRHGAIVDSCVWLANEGYPLEYIEEFAYKAEEALGLERSDAARIIGWVEDEFY